MLAASGERVREAGGDTLAQCILATPTKKQPSLIHLSWYTTHTHPKAASCQRISSLQLGSTTRAQCAEAQLQDAGRLCSLERTASHARSERGLCWPTLSLHKRSAREESLREDTLSRPHVVAHERLTPNLPPVTGAIQWAHQTAAPWGLRRLRAQDSC
jgi:hypothetical protein